MAKLQALGLKQLFNDTDFPVLGRVVRGTFALSLVPLNRLEEAYNIVTQAAANVDKRLENRVNEFITYFERTWLNGPFPRESWNFFACDGTMTNNPAEGK